MNRSKNRKLFSLFALSSSLLALLSSCNSTRRLAKGEYLLTGNNITYHFPKTHKNNEIDKIATESKEGLKQIIVPDEIDKSHITPYLKQKPNTKIFGLIPSRLFIYNLCDSAKSNIHKAKRNQNFIAKDSERVKEGKERWSTEKLNRKLGRKTGREWIMAQGESPVIFDSSLMTTSAGQVKKYLFNKGYFYAKVKDSVHYSGKKATAYYTLEPGIPYTINKIGYSFEDSTLAANILSDTVDCEIKKGTDYDKDNFDAESARIAKLLNNDGYYYFSKSYVAYLLDTNAATHQLGVTIIIKKFVSTNPKNPDVKIVSHHRYMKIRNVTVEMQFDPAKPSSYHAEDTVIAYGCKFVSPKGEMAIKPSALAAKMYLKSRETYSVDNVDLTYTGLTQLKAFRYISIKFAEVKDSNLLDCYIQLMPLLKISIGGEIDGTNTGGDFGVQGDVSYQNIDLFRGAEQLQLKINGGLIAQKLLTSGTGNINKYIPLNTIDLGPELDYSVPRAAFPPFSFFNFRGKYNNPQSTLKLTFNFQQFPDYTRRILGLSLVNFDYNETKFKHWSFSFLEFSYVNATLTPAFSALLQSYNNPFLTNSFKNQVIPDFRISYTYSNQALGKLKDFWFLKISGESAGALEQEFLNSKLPKDASGSYDIEGIPYSQYIKGEVDLRYYWILDKIQRFAIRLFDIGVANPYDNSEELPFSKSFWAGGSNDIRAWQFQTLGPGSSQSSAVIGQIGDIKYESNIEYRVSIIRYFGMAFFCDEGNIWLVNNRANAALPLTFFNLEGQNAFYKELAIGTGIGFRFDFTYFVFRLDLGQPVRDPSLPLSNRWIPLHDYTIKRTVLNFGIGYPF